MSHKAGFVSIIGKPNAGKSTLMNQFVGERLSIITSKAQTTRHRIRGIFNKPEFQIIYSDTPGIIKPKYELHRTMMNFVNQSLQDADIILLVTDVFEQLENEEIIEKLKNIDTSVLLIINKIDLSNQEDVKKRMLVYSKYFSPEVIIPVSALYKFNIEKILQVLTELLPEHPPFFPKDELTDKPQRFFASEIIREKIFIHLDKEVPYSCEVVINSFKELKDIINISLNIMVERDSQKAILIGKKGGMLKKIGTQARKEMESFFKKKIFLKQYVKVIPNWRKKKSQIKKFGYTY